MDVVSHPKEAPTVTMEIGESSEQVAPIKCLLQIDSQASSSQSVHSILSVVENLESMEKFLRNFLSPVEGQYLDE